VGSKNNYLKTALWVLNTTILKRPSVQVPIRANNFSYFFMGYAFECNSICFFLLNKLSHIV